MRRQCVAILCLTVTIAAITACSASTARIAPSATTAVLSPRVSVEPVLRRMSLEEKVGQLLMPVVNGASAESRQAGGPTPAEIIGRYRPGGVIYFPWAGNIVSARQVAELSNGLQRASKVPLLIGVDQENGIVSRLESIATQIPGNMAIGATRDEASAREAAKITGEELRALGITLNLAPVADVNINPKNPVIGVRSFSDDPTLVAGLVGAAVDGFHDVGVAATAKHFPGHGDTWVDSHTGLPVIRHTRAKWERIDRPPFDAAIAHNVDAIMTAHVVMPKLDPSGDPATLSRPILTGLLRQRLGFTGVVITDGLDMAGVRNRYGDGEVAVRAVLAGADLLLMPPSPGKAHAAVLAAVRGGRISAARLDESVRRILRLKASKGLFGRPYVQPGNAISVLRSPAHLAAAQSLADRSVTLVGSGFPPVRRGARVLVTGWATTSLAQALRDQGVAVAVQQTGDAPGGDAIKAAVTQARAADVVVVVTRNANEAQRRLCAALLRTGRLLIVSAGEPYDLARLRASGRLATYSTSEPAMRAAAKVLMGELRPVGRLPVS